METALLVFVPILVTSLVGTWTYLLKTKKHLTTSDHDRICEPRMELVQKDISQLKGGQAEIKGDVREMKRDVSKILVKLGGGSA